MAKFNKKTSVVPIKKVNAVISKNPRSQKVVNRAGGESYDESAKLKLVSLLLTSFVDDQFYRSEKEGNKELAKIIAVCDKKFAAKAAIFARTEFGMRSITHIVAAEIAKTVKGEEWTSRFFDKVVYRPDDATEIISFYTNKYGKRPIPNSLKRGIGKALGRFDEYAISKYRGEGKAFKLVDAVNICHPRPSKALTSLMSGTLKSADTWEVAMTKAGQEAAELGESVEDLKEKEWTRLIETRKIGYFALLRNLRNIAETAPEALDAALKMLVDEKLIKKSLVLPFRYMKAIEIFSGGKVGFAAQAVKASPSDQRRIVSALDRALEISCNNVPKFNGKTLVALDTSGSMLGRPAYIGSLFAGILAKSNNADLIGFSDSSYVINYNINDSLSTIIKGMKFKSGGTNFHSIFNVGTIGNQKYERIVILSDMQGWIGYHAPTNELNNYKKRANADPYIYSWDLQGYGSLMFPENGKKVICLAGFSDKVLDLMRHCEEDKNVLIRKIEEIVI